jgi:diacylglycerol kinase family enzyme
MMTERSRVAVVVNGNARSVTNDVISTLDQILAGGDLFVSRHIDEAKDIAHALVEGGYGTVLTGGGDGTFTVMVTEVVKAARARGAPTPRFGLLKLGTGNALAWVVGASPGIAGVRADIEQLRVDPGASREIRLVSVEGYLAPFAGLGADAEVLSDYNETKRAFEKTPLRNVAAGLLGYAVAATTRSLPGFLAKKMPNVRITVEAGEAFEVDASGHLERVPRKPGSTLFEGPTRIAAVSTIPYVGFGFRLFPYTYLRPDLMQLRVSTMGPIEFLQHVSDIWGGSYRNPASTRDFLVESIRIEADPATALQIGGDPHGSRTSVLASVSQEPVRLVDFYAKRRS